MITNLHPTFPVVGETEIALQHPSFFKFWVLLESNKDITSGFKKMYLPCLLTAKIPDSSDPLFHTRVEADHPSLGILAIQCWLFSKVLGWPKMARFHTRWLRGKEKGNAYQWKNSQYKPTSCFKPFDSTFFNCIEWKTQAGSHDPFPPCVRFWSQERLEMGSHLTTKACQVGLFSVCHEPKKHHFIICIIILWSPCLAMQHQTSLHHSTACFFLAKSVGCNLELRSYKPIASSNHYEDNYNQKQAEVWWCLSRLDV